MLSLAPSLDAARRAERPYRGLQRTETRQPPSRSPRVSHFSARHWLLPPWFVDASAVPHLRRGGFISTHRHGTIILVKKSECLDPDHEAYGGLDLTPVGKQWRFSRSWRGRMPRSHGACGMAIRIGLPLNSRLRQHGLCTRTRMSLPAT